jgi:hypothetical protein
MTRKPFEELTISDDFMFCKVMEHEPICKEFLELLFNVKQPAKKTKKTEEYNIKNNCTLCKDDYMVCKDSPCFITV